MRPCSFIGSTGSLALPCRGAEAGWGLDVINVDTPATLAHLAGQVHLWRFSLIQPDSGVERLRQTLSPDEVVRASRLRFAEHRRRFVVARGVLRSVLGTYLGRPACSLVFRYGAYGKPELEPCAERDLAFNLAHSHELGLLAVSYQRQLGVDIEYLDRHVDLSGLAEHCFSAGERSSLEAMAPARRTLARYHTWVRKEAYVKALGRGLSVPLQSFSVTVEPAFAALLGQVPQDIDPQAAQWAVHPLDLHCDYAAALVVDDGTAALRYFDWPAQSGSQA